MGRPYLKTRARQLCRFLMSRLASSTDEQALRRSALVFSPHPDDETLGCGGTLIKKKRAGAKIGVVFTTDGVGSHSHLMPPHQLRALRAQEALAACRALGIEEENVAFLGFEDGELSEHRDAAVCAIREVLLRQQPEEVFIPYRKDTHEDHLATHRYVLEALRTSAMHATVYEYPVWFWTHWPWADLPTRGRRELVEAAKRSLVGSLSLLLDFRCSVYIGDVLHLKRAALEEHKSQMTRLVPDLRWRTLDEVANGEFLECFFQDVEVFRRYAV